MPESGDTKKQQRNYHIMRVWIVVQKEKSKSTKTIYAEECNTKHICFGDIPCACFLGQQTYGMFIQMMGSSS